MRLAAGALLALGLLQMAGDLLGLPALKGLAAATNASPAPKVFSVAKGLETYSTRFFVEYADAAGSHSVELTAEIYARLRGPYNRRNVYGAVLAYGPVLSTDPRAKPMFESVARRALGGDAPLLRELGLATGAVRGPVRIRYEPLPGTAMEGLPRLLEIPR